MYRQPQLDVFQYVKMWLTLLSPIPSASTNHMSAYTALTTCTAVQTPAPTNTPPVLQLRTSMVSPSESVEVLFDILV
jgi:hypothetical protein